MQNSNFILFQACSLWGEVVGTMHSINSKICLSTQSFKQASSPNEVKKLILHHHSVVKTWKSEKNSFYFHPHRKNKRKTFIFLKPIHAVTNGLTLDCGIVLINVLSKILLSLVWTREKVRKQERLTHSCVWGQITQRHKVVGSLPWDPVPVT